ncbi:MAG: SUMF1/EgtB/PvdO family nonheme iron enzyme [Chloroflexota bacterium]
MFSVELSPLSRRTEAILSAPFEWCWIDGGAVQIIDSSEWEMVHSGSAGGDFQVEGFAIAKYPITNAQYQRFIDAPTGQTNAAWWAFSPEAMQWRKDRPKPRPTAFAGPTLPRTRVSWFDSMAFCAWLSNELIEKDEMSTFDIQNVASWCVRLPTEQEWQRAAVGDSGFSYPWGNELHESRANYGDLVGQPTPVDAYPTGQSPFGVMDMVGNLADWCLTRWGEDSVEVTGYTYRVVKGGAWNISHPEYLRAIDRTGTGPRGVLNDGGFRIVYEESNHRK